jgi:hypothetical protein
MTDEEKTLLEGIRKDFHENRMCETERIERLEKKYALLESRMIIDVAFTKDVKNHLLRWENKIPELVHGAVMSCPSKVLYAETKELLTKHIESEEPHPNSNRHRREKFERRIKWAITSVIALASGATGSFLLMNAFHLIR